jgi:predicted RNase H-like HicB family nuclease
MKKTLPPVEHYAVHIHWDDESECFIAEAPALDGCMADGATREEALKAIKPLIRIFLELKAERGAEIPEPDGVLEDVRRMLPIVNLSKLARAAGLNRATLGTRLRRGTPLPKADAVKVRKALAELAVA